jgi:hypothetical protein
MPTRAHGPSFLAPYPLFAGIVVSFLACTFGGYLAGQRNCFENFSRFHYYISPHSLFFPTAREVVALGEARLDPNKIAVVVGGHSVLWGSGQRPEELWTRRLQELLGSDYQVINLAMAGATPTEFGSVAAEVLTRDHGRLIYIAHAPLLPPAKELEGTFQYLFWDAYSRRLLPPDVGRLAKIRAAEADERHDEKFAELRRGLGVDRWVCGRDLWTAVAYRAFSTVWSANLPGPFITPRRLFADPCSGYGAPREQRYPPSQDEPATNNVRHIIASVRSEVLGVGSECYGPLVRRTRDDFPAALRSRSVLCVLHVSPYYRARLTPAEQAQYNAALAAAGPAYEQAGFAAVEVGRTYCADDFVDHVHLTEEGGAKMAAEVAPRVRALAGALGYSAREERP